MLSVMKLNPDFFRLAAELSFIRKTPGVKTDPYEAYFYIGGRDLPSKYSCDNLIEAESIFNLYHGPHAYDRSDYRSFYKSIYKKDSGTDDGWQWWPDLKNGAWDYESRIFALLFAAEMAEDEQSDRNKEISPALLFVMMAAFFIGVCAWLLYTCPPEFKKNTELVQVDSIIPGL